MATPNHNKRLTPKLTPEQAAELNRLQAAKRQADKRRRTKELADEEARMLAEADARAKAEEEARVQHLADLERRVVEAEAAARKAQEGLDDAVMLLAFHHDVARIRARGASEHSCSVIRKANLDVLKVFGLATRRTWTCTRDEAIERTRRLCKAVDDRRLTLPSTDDPVTVTSNVTRACTPVTATVRNVDGPESNADRSQAEEIVTAEEQAWRDSLGDSPYDPYEAYVAHVEALAEGGADEDDDDGERF